MEQEILLEIERITTDIANCYEVLAVMGATRPHDESLTNLKSTLETLPWVNITFDDETNTLYLSTS